MAITLVDVRQAFPEADRPLSIWQELLDTDTNVAKRLCGLSSQSPRAGDLDDYMSHLRFSGPLQADLLL